MVRHVIAPVDELPPGTRKFLTIDERPIAIFNIKGEFFGLLNRCRTRARPCARAR